MTVRRSSPNEWKGQLPKVRNCEEKDWLATRGSEREKQFLKRWAKQKELSDGDRALISEWIDKPDGFEKRNAAFWEAAKKSVLGPVVYSAAMERHSKLNDVEWLVACFTARAIEQKEIARIIAVGERTVDNIVKRIKLKITQELKCDIASVDQLQIACWFFGL
jgi:DNA-binding CsgD family transcriptional regulator